MDNVIGKYWKPGSATAAAVRAVYGHRELQDNDTSANSARTVGRSHHLVPPTFSPYDSHSFTRRSYT